MLTAPALAPSAHTTSQPNPLEYAIGYKLGKEPKTHPETDRHCPWSNTQVEPHRSSEVRCRKPHKIVPRTHREEMHDGSPDARVAVSLEVQDHLADFVVRGRHPHSAGAIEVLKDL